MAESMFHGSGKRGHAAFATPHGIAILLRKTEEAEAQGRPKKAADWRLRAAGQAEDSHARARILEDGIAWQKEHGTSSQFTRLQRAAREVQ